MSQLLSPHSDGERQSVFCCKAAYSSKVCFWRGVNWEGPRFQGERKVSLAREGDSNGHQASFQTERKGTVERGGGEERREVIKTTHPSPDVSDMGREKKKSGFELLEAFPEARQPISWDGRLSLQVSVSLCWFTLSTLEFHVCFEQTKSINVNEIQLNQLDMQQIVCNNTQE